MAISRRITRRKWATAAATILAVGGIGAGAVWLSGGFGERTLADQFSADGASVHAVEARGVLCAQAACVEGWHTDVGGFLRFPTETAAMRWEAVAGDAARLEKVVVDLSGVELSRDERQRAIDLLYAGTDLQ